MFENPAHDVPQRIHYRRLDDQRAHARIEIVQGNPKQAMDFPMHRVACGGPAPPARTRKRPGPAGASACSQRHTGIHPASVISSAFRPSR
ncbi:hypothetical protein [Stenotrophomonas beteli]|uniref:hypothetical protein n=1 Tax=Stenotrophomonas beteli TaxID=3384461 RepID=UPI001EEFF8A6|nr:hypothetical protein [Stenotrophomonas maltophilia]